MDKLLYTAKTALREDPVRLSGTLPDGCDALMAADGRAFPAQNTEDGVTAILTCAADETLILTPGISDFPKMHLATGADCLAIVRGGHRRVLLGSRDLEAVFRTDLRRRGPSLHPDRFFGEGASAPPFRLYSGR